MSNTQRESQAEELVQQLRKIGEQKPYISIWEFCRDTGVSTSRIYRLFSSWRELRLRAGLEERGGETVARRERPEEILQQIRPLVDEFGDQLTFAEFHRRTGISNYRVNVLFGSWRKLRDAAGIGGVQPHAFLYTDDMLLYELSKLANALGFFPFSGDVDRSRYPWRKYLERFGGRDEVIDALIKWTQENPDRAQESADVNSLIPDLPQMPIYPPMVGWPPLPGCQSWH